MPAAPQPDFKRDHEQGTSRDEGDGEAEDKSTIKFEAETRRVDSFIQMTPSLHEQPLLDSDWEANALEHMMLNDRDIRMCPHKERDVERNEWWEMDDQLHRS
jgi:hypothetical protein